MCGDVRNLERRIDFEFGAVFVDTNDGDDMLRKYASDSDGGCIFRVNMERRDSRVFLNFLPTKCATKTTHTSMGFLFLFCLASISMRCLLCGVLFCVRSGNRVSCVHTIMGVLRI